MTPTPEYTGTFLWIAINQQSYRKVEVYSAHNIYIDIPDLFGAPKAFWIRGTGAEYYITGDKIINCTGGRVSASWGNQAGIIIEKDSIYKGNRCGSRGISYARAWKLGVFINITYVKNFLPISDPQGSSLHFNSPTIGSLSIMNCTFSDTAY